MKKYRVLREHLGDRHYAEGHMREAEAVHVTHLVQNGILKEMTEEEVAAHLAEHPEAEKKPDGDSDAKADGSEKPAAGEGAADAKAEGSEKGAAEFRRTKAQPPAGDSLAGGAA